MITIDKLRKDYEASHALYTDLLQEVSNQLKIILEGHGMMKIAEISKRVKKFDSIEQNISTYKFDPKIPEHLGLITDLAGIRVAVLFKGYVDPMCASIEKVFDVKEKKHIFNEDDQFGYTSVHYEVSLKRDSCEADIFEKLGSLIAEIQVRTLAQHLWASAAHYLNYKERKDVGKPLQRPLSRISALLELIDGEYDRLLNLKEEYLKNADISDTAETLNVDLLSKIIKEEFPANKGFDLNEGMSGILDDLFLFEIKTVKDFRNLLNKQKTNVLEHQEIGFKIMEEVEPDMMHQSISFSIQGIIRKMLDYEFSEKDGFEFFEKMSRLPAGTMEKLISTIKKKEG
jgi:ppGpp synthetase/RelA/SpoT-type nucleotidyltranferase